MPRPRASAIRESLALPLLPLLFSLVLSLLLTPALSSSHAPPRDALAALQWEIRSLKQNLTATLQEIRSLNGSFLAMPQLPWGNLTSNVIRCFLPYNWSQIIEREEQGNVQIGGLGHLMQIDRYEVWVCDFNNRCVQQAGDAMCFVFDEVQEVFVPWGLDSQLRLTQQGPFQPDLAISYILAKLKALEQEIRSGGCGTSCMARQDVQLLLDQYYLEPGHLWSAGSFGECSSLCGSGVARRSVTCVSKLKEQVEDYLCANRSKPLAEAPCVDVSQCSYDWQVGPYGSCLASCGQGLRRRDVSCRRSDGVSVNAAMCVGQAPVAEEPCSDVASCSYRWTWTAWEACSSTCGSGVQYRSVGCSRSDGVEVEDGMCFGTKPVTFQACTGASGCNYSLTNECAMHTDNCAIHARCVDTYASFECSCFPGYAGSGTVCEDLDECVMQAGTCDQTERCVNTEGSFVCLCKEGFFSDASSSSGACASCPATYTSTALGQTACTACAPGYYGDAGSGCSACPAGSSSGAGSKLVTDCQCQYGFIGNITSAQDRCQMFGDVEEQSRWFRLGASGMSCAATCATEGKTCVSSAMNQIDNEEAMRSAVRAASMASDRRVRAAMTEPQQRPEGLHLRMSAGGGRGLEDLTANSGHVRRQRYVEHNFTSYPLVTSAWPYCCYISHDFYVDVPAGLRDAKVITVRVTVEDADPTDRFSTFLELLVGGMTCNARTDALYQMDCRLELPLKDAITDGEHIGPITISWYRVDYNGRSTWRISVGQMQDVQDPLPVMSDGGLLYVNGSASDVVIFPPMSIPAPVFTICSISRYNGIRKTRVLQSSTTDFVHGHWDEGRGQAYYAGSWYLQEDLSATADEWVVLCGQNYQEGKFFLNGVEYDRSAGSLPESLQLAINAIVWSSATGFFLDSSDWALSEVAIWRGALRGDEIRAVSQHFMRMLSAGSDVPYNQSLNVSCDATESVENTIAPYISDLGCRFRSQESQSTCDSSMYGASRVCVCSAPCLENFYGQASECVRCPFYSHSQPGSSSIADCLCSQGRYMYVNTSGSLSTPRGSCNACPVNAWSPNGSSSVNQCQCISGYYRDQGPACAACPSRLMSPYASSSLADCLCDAGRYGTNGNCSSCPAHSTSRAGSTSIEDCFCLPGFGVRVTGYSRQVTSPYQECEIIQEEMLLGDTTGSSCSEVCGAKNLFCWDEAQPTLTQNEVLFQLQQRWGLSVSQIQGSTSPDAPSYNPTTGVAFYRHGLPGTCSAKSSTNVRICRCTCADNQYGGRGSCSACPGNSSSVFSAQDQSSCMCNSGFYFDAARGACSLCPAGTYAKYMRLVDSDFGHNGTMGWQGTGSVSSCGRYGSLLGGLNVLGEWASVSKTFTGLCPHGFAYLRLRLLLIDVVQPVTVRLSVNRLEVWNQTVSPSAFSESACGWREVDGPIDQLIRVYHVQDYLEVKVQVEYDYFTVNATSAKTFWGLKEFVVELPCSSSSSADCTMTAPAAQTCSDVSSNGQACMQAGGYLYVRSDQSQSFWDAEATCNGIGNGGHLAYFANEAIFDEVAGYGWIGLMSYEGVSGSFRWTATNSAPSFTRWNPGIPNFNGQTSCAYMYSGGWWYDTGCYVLRPFVCSFPAFPM